MFNNAIKLFLSVCLFGMIQPVESSANMFSQSISDETPASFFASGIEAYHFSESGLSIIRYKNAKLSYGEEKIQDKHKYANINLAAENILGILANVEMILGQDGSVNLIRTDENYACKHNEILNCLYSDTSIVGIDVQNIMGRTEIVSVDASMPLLKSDNLNFRIGAKVYTFKVYLPAFDFKEFDDFNSLVCSKNDIGECRQVVNDGSLDQQALFELHVIKPELEDMMFSDTSADGVIYGFDINNAAVIPYSAECTVAAEDMEMLQSCAVTTLPTGTITENKHREGFIYWIVDYKNPKIENEIFWINNSGEPFKAFTNSERTFSFKMLNKAAAETIFDAL